ncbi:MAG: chemotaxis-specific protein-glutamate methyltransferase CheB [Lachnospiraceae bacterium]|nr:chemotaxis-specific protein-glutamate methyltransferase CheB [Lachnospiraceae bacterium]
MKKILLVDDSALMRRVMCDIIDSDSRFSVEDRATNGLEALDLLQRKTYDAVVLDVNMPKMDGIALLKELHKRKIGARVMMASTLTLEGAKVTLDCLDLGALDFIHKPDNASDCRDDEFKHKLLHTLYSVSISRMPTFESKLTLDSIKTDRKVVELASKHASSYTGSKIVAIASSTGGPKALQSVIPKLPANLAAPVVLVQHMPVGFTASLAERLNSLGDITVTEAQEGDILEAGHVYISKGGQHMNVLTMASKYSIHYTDEPSREGVKPCANYMYESLRDSKVNEIVCVVMTGMGADGTEGIEHLKEKKRVHVITQTESTCAVYGMPKSVDKKGLSDQRVPLDQIAQEIILNVGVR